MLGWACHFNASRDIPMYTVNLSADSLEETCWWRCFFIEIGVLDEHDKVFKDLICSTPRKVMMMEGED